jgi:hypothetical protein
MKEENVNLAELRVHPEYIRHRKNTDYISELATVLNDAGKWIFPAIELQPIASTEKIYQEEGARYYIIDGVNRVSAAIEINWKHKIPAKIHSPLTSLEAIALQVKTNMAHGLRLTASDQTAAIKKLHELGMQGKTIAEKTGLSMASVSRIVSDKQRATASGAPGNVDKSGQEKKTAKPFKTEDWLKILGRVLKGWEKHGPKIRKSAGFPDACGKALDTIADALSK